MVNETTERTRGTTRFGSFVLKTRSFEPVRERTSIRFMALTLSLCFFWLLKFTVFRESLRENKYSKDIIMKRGLLLNQCSYKAVNLVWVRPCRNKVGRVYWENPFLVTTHPHNQKRLDPGWCKSVCPSSSCYRSLSDLDSPLSRSPFRADNVPGLLCLSGPESQTYFPHHWTRHDHEGQPGDLW